MTAPQNNACIFIRPPAPLLALVLGLLALLPAREAQAQLPPNFVDEVVVSGLNQPISMRFLPDGRLLLLQKEGEVLLADPAQGWATATYMTLTDIHSTDERGLIDIAIDPDFDTNGYVYLYYMRRTPRRARIARFTHQENSGGLTSTGDPGSEFVVWEETWPGDPYENCCHYGAGLDFGPDGAIYLTPGDKFDGANAQDRTTSAGSIIRINPDGTIPADNPYVGNANGWDESIWAYGLRNPFRARWDLTPGEERLFIGEVGGNDQSRSWEDLHLGEAGANYGWPYCEGPFDRPNLLDDFPECDTTLYTGPIYAYDHLGPTPNGGSITGGFVYRGGTFPGSYEGAYFFGDYAATYIRYLTFDPTDPTVVTGDFDFQPDAGPIVALDQGPDGALYYIQISGFLRRIVFGGLSVTSSATPTSGPSPLAVSFDGEATGGGGPLTYTWTFGDGTDSGPLSDPATSHTYTADGAYDAVLEVTDGTLTSTALPITIQVGTPPTATVLTPTDGALFRAGDTIAFSGDGSGGAGGLELSWTVQFGHNNHFHPVLSDFIGASGTFDIPTSGHDYADSTRYEIELTVTDALGLTATDQVTVYPDKVDITYETVPVPIPVTIDDLPVTPPYVIDDLIGFERTVSVPASRCVAGTEYVFDSWSDGGAREHLIVVPATDATYTATFTDNGACTGVPITDGLALYLEADRGVTETGGVVSAWADQSGLGNDLTAAGDPSIGVVTTPSGLPAIAFDGAGDTLERAASLNGLPAGGADRTVFLVAEYGSDGWGGFTYGDTGCDEAFGLVVDDTGDLAVQSGCDGYPTGEAGNGAGWLTQAAVLSGTTLTHYKDGAVIDTEPAASFNTVLTRIVLGAEIDASPTLDMDVAAVLVYDRALTDADRQQVETYLYDKYLDVPPPVALATITSPADGAFVLGPDVTVSWTAYGPGQGDHVHLTLDGAPHVTVPLNGSYTFTGLADGPHTLTAEVASIGHQVYAGSEDTVAFTVTSGGTLPGGGLVLRLETDFNVVVSGTDVGGWLDQSGNGNDLAASGDPQLAVAGTPSGMDAIVLDGTGDWLERTASLNNLPSGSADRTMFAVIRYDAASTYAGVAYGDGAPNQAFGLTVDGGGGRLTVQGWGAVNDHVSTEVGTGAGWLVQSVIVANDAVTHYKDGAVVDAFTHTYNTDPERIVLGEEIAGAGDGEAMALAAVLLYDRALSETERQQAEAFLQQKYLVPNVPPVALDDAATLAQGATAVLDVLANDTDDTGLDPATVTIVDAPVNGTVDAIDSGTGAITYTHDGSATTTDSLTYTVDDVDGATSNVATVLITVTPAQVSITETYDAGWGLVSLPATVSDPDYLAVFEGGAGGDPQSPVYVVPGTFNEFDGAYYTPSPPELTLGVGAWLKFSQEATVILDGDYVGSLDRVLGGGGWYLFSGPSCSVP
ncbi:MAG: PQQ-dependent sugar dehydrogenase, partial [Rubricoccaceae bacterium]|nr:PQQ-dependent sugar dehydrogenase [Rubricoccaceae bacterium]